MYLSRFTPINRIPALLTPQSTVVVSSTEQVEPPNGQTESGRRHHPAVAHHLGLVAETDLSCLENYASEALALPPTLPRGRKRSRKKLERDSADEDNKVKAKGPKQSRVSEGLGVTESETKKPRQKGGCAAAPVRAGSTAISKLPPNSSALPNTPVIPAGQDGTSHALCPLLSREPHGLSQGPTIPSPKTAGDQCASSPFSKSTMDPVSDEVFNLDPFLSSVDQDSQDAFPDEDVDDIFNSMDLDTLTNECTTGRQYSMSLLFPRQQDQLAVPRQASTSIKPSTCDGPPIPTPDVTNDTSPLPSIGSSRNPENAALHATGNRESMHSSQRNTQQFVSPMTPKSQVPIKKSAISSSEARKPIVRPPFPPPVRDRSPIIGLSSNLLLRTCFRIGETINQASHASKSGKNMLFELYARVLSSTRDEAKQLFVFGDLFHDRPPHIKGVYDAAIWRQVELYNYDSGRLLEQRRMCRCIGRMRRDRKEWTMQVLNIWETTWEDIEWVEGIADG